MKFAEALEKVYNGAKDKTRLNNCFFVYSGISDLIGSSYADKKKAELFFKINNRVNIFQLATQYGKKAAKKIVRRYGEVSGLLTKEAFVNLINLVVKIIRN